MSVSTYNLNCGYRKLNLKSVYLIPESHLKRIHIDNGEAYIDGLNTAPYFIDADEVTLNEETSLDERYRFSKTLTFRVRGRKELDFLHERYYAIVRTEENVNYCVNVEFPSTVSYVYNLSQDRDETTFTLRTESNHPTLRLATVISDVNVCKGYFMACVKKLRLLEKNKTALREGYTVTSSEPFKDVDFLRPSITFSEEYNGSNVTTTLTFDIPLGLYKSSWDYNLLEFIDNTYAMILEGCNGYNYAGFHFGLEPSFVITGDADNAMISMMLKEMSESGGWYSQEPIPENINTATTYQFTDEHDGYICIEGGLAQYTLQKELNFLGNPTGNYRALEGFEDLFPDLNIVGTFTEVMLFPTDKCGGEGGGGMTGGTLPDIIELQSGECKSFTFSAVCDWHVSESTEDLSITPTSGVANRLYTITVCKDAAPSSICNYTLSDYNPTIIMYKQTDERGIHVCGNVTITGVSSCGFGGYHSHEGYASGGCPNAISDRFTAETDAANVSVPIVLEKCYTFSNSCSDEVINEYMSAHTTANYDVNDKDGNTMGQITANLVYDGEASGECSYRLSVETPTLYYYSGLTESGETYYYGSTTISGISTCGFGHCHIVWLDEPVSGRNICDLIEFDPELYAVPNVWVPLHIHFDENGYRREGISLQDKFDAILRYPYFCLNYSPNVAGIETPRIRVNLVNGDEGNHGGGNAGGGVAGSE